MGPGIVQRMGNFIYRVFSFRGVLQFAGQYLRQGSVFFALAVISYYVVLGIWKIILLFSEKGNRYCEVVVFFGERNCRLRALIDTGNTLKDTVSKDPVSVMDQASVKRLTEGKQPERFRYIPYHSIGKKRELCLHFAWIRYRSYGMDTG